MFQADFQIEKAKEFLKHGMKELEGGAYTDEDRKFFKDAKKSNQAAEALIEEDDGEKKSLLLIQYIQYCNKLMFLVFRKGNYKELEKEFKKLSSIEEAAKGYEVFAKRHQEERDKIQALIDEDREREHKMDIFKGVLNGMSAEQAEEQLNKYEKQVKQAIQGQ